MITVEKRPSEFSWSGNTIFYELQSDAAAADPLIFFEVRIYFKNVAPASIYQVIVTIPLIPVGGTVIFNIQDILHSHLLFIMPGVASTATVVDCPGQSGQFYISFREITPAGLDPAWDATEAAQARTIFKGGLHPFKYEVGNYWSNYLPYFKPFLTWQKSGRKASRTELMYLSWINFGLSGSDSLQFVANVVFTDGTAAQGVHAFTGKPFHVYMIPTGAAQLDLQNLGIDKSIYYWEVTVLDISVPATPVAKSESFRYYADNRNDYNQVQFNFRNSLGGLDSVRILGVIETSTEYEFTETGNYMEPEYYSFDTMPSVEATSTAREDQLFKGDIGYLERGEQDRLRDAFLQREVYQLIVKKWWPVKLLTKSIKLHTSKDKVFSLPIEWKYADGGSKYYSPAEIYLGERVVPGGSGGGGEEGGGIDNSLVVLNSRGSLKVLVKVGGGTVFGPTTISHNNSFQVNDDENATVEVSLSRLGFMYFAVISLVSDSISYPGVSSGSIFLDNLKKTFSNVNINGGITITIN